MRKIFSKATLSPFFNALTNVFSSVKIFGLLLPKCGLNASLYWANIHFNRFTQTPSEPLPAVNNDYILVMTNNKK